MRGIDLDLRRGEVLGLLGPNGAGKTTTMQMLTGNLAPSTGSISICGIDLLERPTAAKARIGYLPEVPPLYKELTVDEYLRLAARLHRVPRKQAEGSGHSRQAPLWCRGRGRAADRHAVQRLPAARGIAQAIIHEPDVVILDEPTVGLDPNQIREIRTLIRELRDRHSVILSTHILPEVEAVCDRVQILHHGAIVYNDTIEALRRFRGGQALRVGLRSPPALEETRSAAGRGERRSSVTASCACCPQDGQDPTDAIVRASVERDWGLYYLAPEAASLEDVFVQLTTAEPRQHDPDHRRQGIAAAVHLAAGLGGARVPAAHPRLDLPAPAADVLRAAAAARDDADARPGLPRSWWRPCSAPPRIVLLMVVPLLSMRLIAEERRNQTLPFLMSAPVSITQIVLGKFLGAAGFLSLAVALLVLMALSLYFGGKLDLGLLAGNVLGLLLLSGSFAAVGLYLSCLTAHPLVARSARSRVLLVLWLVNIAATDPDSVLHLLSLIKHFDTFAKGMVALNDLVYYLVLIALFLLLVDPAPGRRPAARMKASARLQLQLLVQNGIFAVLLVAAAVSDRLAAAGQQGAMGPHAEPAQHAVAGHAATCWRR